MIGVNCTDGTGSSQKAMVTDNALLVTNHTCPPLIPQKNKVWSHKLTDDGLSTGSDDLGVDGSSTSVDYWVSASETADRYITRLSIICGYGASAPLYDFVDSGSELTNGVWIKYTDAFGDIVTIGNPKRNYSFLRLGLRDGIIPTAWELRNLGASNDYGFIVSIDMTAIIPPFGCKIDMGSDQKVTVTIRDNCSDADTFNCNAFGFERFE